MTMTLVLLTRGPRSGTVIETDVEDLPRLEEEEGALDFRGRDGMRPDRDDFAVVVKPSGGYDTRELKAAPPPAPLPPEAPSPERGKRNGRT